jgi:hypothetical protein
MKKIIFIIIFLLSTGCVEDSDMEINSDNLTKSPEEALDYITSSFQNKYEELSVQYGTSFTDTNQGIPSNPLEMKEAIRFDLEGIWFVENPIKDGVPDRSANDDLSVLHIYVFDDGRFELRVYRDTSIFGNNANQLVVDYTLHFNYYDLSNFNLHYITRDGLGTSSWAIEQTFDLNQNYGNLASYELSILDRNLIKTDDLRLLEQALPKYLQSFSTFLNENNLIPNY